MRGLIARHPKTFCTAAFIAVMGVFSIVWRWFVYGYGASWLEVGAIIGAFLVIGLLFDRRDQRSAS
jgi:hypothetical protein